MPTIVPDIYRACWKRHRFLLMPILISWALLSFFIFPGILMWKLDNSHISSKQFPGYLPADRSKIHFDTPQLYYCDDIFGVHQISRDGNCLQHEILKWLSCDIGPAWVDPGKILGSLGGESIDKVMGRPEQEEQLNFTKGGLLVASDFSQPSRFVESVDRHVRSLLQSREVTSLAKKAFLPATSNGITLLVRRGNYANPCMVLLTIYNVYVVLQHYFDFFKDGDDKRLSIVWLDGHAKGDLDILWQDLFHVQPMHVRRLQTFGHWKTNTSVTPLSEQTMIVNTMSAIGDEGMGLYNWAHAPLSKCQQANSTLIQFRDFVLRKYNIRFSNPPERILTFLVRKDYRAHPRAGGFTDRTLENDKADASYLQSLYPSHQVRVVSFEGMPFQMQLQIMTSTDIFVAVHGAGNIHVLFLPDGATFVEYVPKQFRQRKRFHFLAECLNHTYISAKPTWTGRRQVLVKDESHIAWSNRSMPTASKELIEIRLRPFPAF